MAAKRNTQQKGPTRTRMKAVGVNPDGTVRAEGYSELVAQQIGDLAQYLQPNEIAIYIGMHPDELKRIYGEIMVRRRLEANVEVARSLFQNTKHTEGKEAQVGVRAQEFWLKSQAGWRDRDEKKGKGASEGIEIHIHV